MRTVRADLSGITAGGVALKKKGGGSHSVSPAHFGMLCAVPPRRDPYPCGGIVRPYNERLNNKLAPNVRYKAGYPWRENYSGSHPTLGSGPPLNL